jgi:hypothetical protein
VTVGKLYTVGELYTAGELDVAGELCGSGQAVWVFGPAWHPTVLARVSESDTVTVGYISKKGHIPNFENQEWAPHTIMIYHNLTKGAMRGTP